MYLIGVPPAAAQLGKTPKTAARRRALGDITNATPARGVATDFKASIAKANARPAAAEPAIATSQHSVAEAQIQAWAEEGVERRAGKSWAVMEAERRRRDEADIAAGVEATLSFLKRGPPAYGSVGAVTPIDVTLRTALHRAVYVRSLDHCMHRAVSKRNNAGCSRA